METPSPQPFSRSFPLPPSSRAQHYVRQIYYLRICEKQREKAPTDSEIDIVCWLRVLARFDTPTYITFALAPYIPRSRSLPLPQPPKTHPGKSHEKGAQKRSSFCPKLRCEIALRVISKILRHALRPSLQARHNRGRGGGGGEGLWGLVRPTRRVR